MAGKASREWKVFPLVKSKEEKKRTIIVGLKSDNYSREMLLRFLHKVVNPRDNVLAIHVQEPSDTFDPNTFYIHEDICKAKQVSHGLLILEAKGLVKHFTFQELNLATNNFGPEMVIGVGGHSKVYRANLGDGQAVAVKILKETHFPAEDLLHEVRILSDIKHENIIQIIGYCYSKEMHAIVYNLLIGSLKQNLRQLKWNERMGVAVGVAQALEYLHHSFNPPIIHRDVKSSNILLSGTCQPQLSDFGAAMVNQPSEQNSASTKPFKEAKIPNKDCNFALFEQILRLFQEPEYWLNMQRERDKLLNAKSKEEKFTWRMDDSTSTATSTLPLDDSYHEILPSEAPD
ncbi:hypothetical protein H0E87_017100 [Populus deltoides]|uniref:Protein kinase domain-containing protein n=1 Tax=Populus deltoides TaxID=3696 RepID=A0A8T2XYW1_POPDE|nr:hypothetical protein H0E87_017100 [Populus deltoides]